MTRLVPLHLIVPPPNIPAGLSPFMLLAIAHELRNGGAEVRDPIPVRPHGERWIMSDGRHRWVGSWIAGRRDVLCQEKAR